MTMMLMRILRTPDVSDCTLSLQSEAVGDARWLCTHKVERRGGSYYGPRSPVEEEVDDPIWIRRRRRRRWE